MFLYMTVWVKLELESLFCISNTGDYSLWSCVMYLIPHTCKCTNLRWGQIVTHFCLSQFRYLNLFSLASLAVRTSERVNVSWMATVKMTFRSLYVQLMNIWSWSTEAPPIQSHFSQANFCSSSHLEKAFLLYENKSQRKFSTFHCLL